MWKRKISKNAQKNSVFWVVVKKHVFFVNMSFFRKIGNHYLCSDGKKQTRIFVATICFWKMVLFLWPFQVTKHYKIGVSADTGENPKWHFWLQKCHFGKGPRKVFYYLWFLKAVLCWKHYFYSVFSKTQLCRHERAKKAKNKNRGGLPEWTGVFFGPFLGFGGFVFFGFSVFLCFCFVHNSPKWLFSCIFRGFFVYFVPTKGLS